MKLKPLKPATLKSNTLKMKTFLQFLNNKKLGKVTKEDIENYYIYLNQEVADKRYTPKSFE